MISKLAEGKRGLSPLTTVKGWVRAPGGRRSEVREGEEPQFVGDESVKVPLTGLGTNGCSEWTARTPRV